MTTIQPFSMEEIISMSSNVMIETKPHHMYHDQMKDINHDADYDSNITEYIDCPDDPGPCALSKEHISENASYCHSIVLSAREPSVVANDHTTFTMDIAFPNCAQANIEGISSLLTRLVGNLNIFLSNEDSVNNDKVSKEILLHGDSTALFNSNRASYVRDNMNCNLIEDYKDHKIDSIVKLKLETCQLTDKAYILSAYLTIVLEYQDDVLCMFYNTVSRYVVENKHNCTCRHLYILKRLLPCYKTYRPLYLIQYKSALSRLCC